MKSLGNRWPRRIGLLTLAAIAVFIASTLFGVSELLALSSVKTEMQRKLSQAVQGHVAWDALQLRLLPSPRLVLRGLAIDTPGQEGARIEQAEARLRLLALMRGSIEVTSLTLVRPVLRVGVESFAPQSKQPSIDPLDLYRSVLGPLVQAIRNGSPGTVLEVTEGSVEIHGPTIPDIQVSGLWLRARTDSLGADLEASAAGGPWDSMNVRGRAQFADLSGQLTFEVAGLRPQPWLDRAFSGTTIGLEIPRATLRAGVSTDGRSALNCDFRLEIAAMNVTRKGRGLSISHSSLVGAALVHAHDAQIEVSELRLGSLLPSGRATLLVTSIPERAQVALEIPRLDVSELRNAVLALASDSALVRQHAPRLLSGDIVNTRLSAEANTWQELFGSAQLAGSATLAGAAVLIPAIEQKATALGGRITFSDTTLELAAASARLGQSELRDARLRYSMRERSTSASLGFELDLAQGIATAREVLSPAMARALSDIESAAGRLHGRASLVSTSTSWNSTIDVTQSDASLRLQALPWPMSVTAVHAELSPGRASISGLDASVGRSTFTDVGVVLALGTEQRIGSGHGRASLALAELYPWLRGRDPAAPLLRDIDSVSGTARIALQSLSGALRQPLVLGFDAIVQPEQVQVQMKQLPGPIAISGGTVRIDPDTIQVDHVATAMLDTRCLLSGAINDYRGEHLRLRANVADAVVGDDSAHWLWQRLDAPIDFEPKTPLRLSVEQVTWNPGREVQAQVQLAFEGGPDVTLDVQWQPDALDLRRVVIRDQLSELTLGLRAEDRLIDAKFSGTLFGQSIAAMLKRPGDFRGRATGDLRVRLDFERSGRSSAHGHVVAEALQWDGFLPVPVRIDRLELSANGSSLQIREAVVSLAQQPATFRGELTRGEKGLVINGQLDSPGFVVDALLHGLTAPRQLPAGAQERPPAAPLAAHVLHPWTLPVTGQIQVRSDFIQYQRYRFAPVTATVRIGEQDVQLHVLDTALCGISLPMKVTVMPGGFTASVQMLAQKQQLEAFTRCMTDERVLLTGEFDLRANLTSKGPVDERLKNLEGTVQFESRDGKVRKFALIANIVAITDITGRLRRDSSGPAAEGFPYRTLTIDGHFKEGRFLVDESFFDSSSFGLAATGSVGLIDRDTQLTVLFAPFSLLDRLVRMVPIIGYLIGGTLTSVPMNVSGDIADPWVVPLGPRAVASEVTAFLTRLLSLPGRRREPLAPVPEPSPASSER